MRVRSELSGNIGITPAMLCAAIDIGSNTTRVLVAEPVDGQLKKVMEQRAYTRINKAIDDDGAILDEKIEEVAEVVATQVRLARELGAETIRAVATAAVREAGNGERAAKAIAEAAGVEVDVLSDEEEGRLSFIGATKTLGHPVSGQIGVVDIGGGSTEVILGTVQDGAQKVRSWKVGSGVLADELIASDPPSAAEIRKVRDRIDDIFEGVELERPDQAVAVGGSATSLRKLVGAVLEYETLERGIRVLCGDPAADVARRFELDPVRVRILADRSAAAREGLRAARAAAADRQGRPARGGHPRPPQRQRQRLAAAADRRLGPRASLMRWHGRETYPGSTARSRSRWPRPGWSRPAPPTSSSTATASSGSRTSSRCTTCGSPAGACGRRSRCSGRASRASATSEP